MEHQHTDTMDGVMERRGVVIRRDVVIALEHSVVSSTQYTAMHCTYMGNQCTHSSAYTVACTGYPTLS